MPQRYISRTPDGQGPRPSYHFDSVGSNPARPQKPLKSINWSPTCHEKIVYYVWICLSELSRQETPNSVGEWEDNGWLWWWCSGGGPIPRPGPTLCASLRSGNALGHCTRAILCGNLQVKRRRPAGAPWLSTGLYTYRKNPSVWTHCLLFGQKVTTAEILKSIKKIPSKKQDRKIFTRFRHNLAS